MTINDEEIEQGDMICVMNVGFTGFGVGKIRNSSSALVRPFRILVNDGNPVGKINYIFFKSDQCYVLGALCFTPGKRLLFFPGLTSRTPGWHTKGWSTPPNVRATGLVDHLTLEKDLKSAHVTMLGPRLDKRVIGRFSTENVAADLTYWFGLSIQSEQALELCPEEIEFTFTSTPDDCKRRMDDVIQSREGSVFHIVELSPDLRKTHDCFLHFDFLVDQQNRKSLTGLIPAPTRVPTGPPALRKEASTLEIIMMRAHPTKIPFYEGIIWIVSSVRSGELTERAILTFPH